MAGSILFGQNMFLFVFCFFNISVKYFKQMFILSFKVDYVI